MEQNEILSGNKIIADFDGWVKREGFDFLYKKKGRNIASDQFNYHKSWDWLMPVVEKINVTKIKGNKFPAGVIIFKTTCHINDDDQILVETTSNGSLIECVWLAVVNFIKWYNSNK